MKVVNLRVNHVGQEFCTRQMLHVGCYDRNPDHQGHVRSEGLPDIVGVLPFFFFFLIVIYWTEVVLQRCVRCTAK